MRICSLTRCALQKAAQFAFAWLLFVLSHQPAAAQTSDAWTVDHFGQAAQAQRDGNLSLAESEYRQVISRNPNLAAAYLNLGIVCHQQKKYADAVTVLNRAVQLDPHLLGAQLFLGIDQYQSAEYKGAKEHLKRALTLSSH